jgi:hypothetical protein
MNTMAKKDSVKSNHDIETITVVGKEATRYVKTLARKSDTVGIEFDVRKKRYI